MVICDFFLAKGSQGRILPEIRHCSTRFVGKPDCFFGGGSIQTWGLRGTRGGLTSPPTNRALRHCAPHHHFIIFTEFSVFMKMYDTGSLLPIHVHTRGRWITQVQRDSSSNLERHTERLRLVGGQGEGVRSGEPHCGFREWRHWEIF